jgi:glycine/D-amino acid oxidase-like deaminating enzyme
MAAETHDVLVIGGGIAGSAAAYFARQRGRSATVVDAGIDCASRVPTAMINPVRGYRGRSSASDANGALFTLGLIDELCSRGHAIKHGRGVLRPIPDEATEHEWRGALSDAIAHRWLARDAVPAALAGEWRGALFLPDAGWVEPEGLLGALRSEAGAHWVTASAVRIDASRRSVVLEDGQALSARDLVWCGGAWGAARIGRSVRYRPGTVLVTRERITDDAVSYGLYAAPHGGASVVGPTTEAMFARYPDESDAAAPIAALIERVAATYSRPVEIASQWRGVRLEAAQLPEGLQTLTLFGSRGYLLAPLAAARWAQAL